MKLHRFGLLFVLSLMVASVPAAERSWRFEVFLNDSSIGEHDFILDQDGPRSELKTRARFNVKLWVINAYRYEHDASEQWRGDCLQDLDAQTNDNGKRLAVRAQAQGEVLRVTAGAARRELTGCVMSFAYWNSGILKATRLLNSQTGKYEAVSVQRLPDETLKVQGREVPARRYRITGPENPIDLWYSASDSAWLALESTLSGGKRLSYRLK